MLWFFSTYFASSLSPALGCHVRKNNNANKSDCTRRYLIRWVALLHTGDGLPWIRKHTIFNDHSCVLLTLGQSVLLDCSAEFASQSEFVRWTARSQIGNWRQIWQRSEKSQYLKGKNTIFLDTLYTMNRISYWYKRERDIYMYLLMHT